MWLNVPENVYPFKHVLCDTLLGYWRVSWELQPRFSDPTPWLFQVQMNQYGDQPDGWTDAGEEVEDGWSVEIPFQPNYIPSVMPGFRVRLTTQNGQYVSGQAYAFGNLTYHQRNLAAKIVRLLRLQRPQLPRKRGYLLKRRYAGLRCLCVSDTTGDPGNSRCTTCYGTGIVGGYWKASDLPVVLLGATAINAEVSAHAGVMDAQPRSAIAVGLPFIYPRDIWVDSMVNRRYAIRNVQIAAELSGVPLALSLTMISLPPDHVIYQFPITDG